MDGNVTTVDTISGTLSVIGTLSGSLSPPVAIHGELNVPIYIDVDLYSGDYDVSPDFTGKTLDTANKTLTDNIMVKPIEVQTMSNSSGGLTVYIGGI